MMLTNPRDAFRGQSRSTNMVAFWVHCGFSLQQYETAPRLTVAYSVHYNERQTAFGSANCTLKYKRNSEMRTRSSEVRSETVYHFSSSSML